MRTSFLLSPSLPCAAGCGCVALPYLKFCSEACVVVAKGHLCIVRGCREETPNNRLCCPLHRISEKARNWVEYLTQPEALRRVG